MRNRNIRVKNIHVKLVENPFLLKVDWSFVKRFIQGKKHMNVIFVKRPLFKEVTYLSTRGNIQEKSHKEEIKEEERVVDQSAI